MSCSEEKQKPQVKLPAEECEEKLHSERGDSNPDPHDPLTWSLTRKLGIMFIVGIWILLGTTNMIIIGPALQIIPVDLHSSFNTSTYLVGGPLLAYGAASFIWVPLGNRYGVRIVFVICAITAACMSVWGAKARSFGSLVAARTLASAFFAPPETLAPQMIGDLFYLKDRSKAMTWIGILQASGFAGGPLVGSFIVQNQDLGWRWVQWTMAILTFASAIGLFFFFPETQYTERPDIPNVKRTFKDNLRFWPVSGGGQPKSGNLALGFLNIFSYFGHPVIVLNMAFFSLCLLVNSYLLTTQSLTYLIVYPFSIGASGLTFIAPLIGTWLAMLFCGILADRLFIRWTAKEGAKPKPEHRLPLLLVTGPIGIAGLLLFGICTQEQCHWVAPLFGSAMLSFCFISSLSISFAYLLDIYESRTDAVMVIYNGCKNLAAFAISYAIIPWNTKAGYTVPFVVMAIILLIAHLFMVLCYFRGQSLRRWTTARVEHAEQRSHGESL